MGKQSPLLIDSDQNLVLQIQLAIVVGDRQAIALQQIHYWCNINSKTQREGYFFDDHWWTRNTWAEWKKNNFPFWSTRTIRRVFEDLDRAGLIVIRPHVNNSKGLWITVNYLRLEIVAQEKQKLLKAMRPKSLPLDKMDRGGGQNDQPTGDPENSIENKEKKEQDSLRPNDVADSGRSKSVAEKTDVTQTQSQEQKPEDAVLSRQTPQEEGSITAAAQKPKPDYTLLVDAVAQHFFGIPPEQINGKKIGGRVGKIAGWLNGTSAPGDLGRLSHAAKPMHVEMYAKWWRKVKKVTLPHDPVKFAEGWREWAGSLKPQSNGKPDDLSGAVDWGSDHFTWEREPK